MSSLFYARYIPPTTSEASPNVKIKGDTTDRKSNKRKREVVQETPFSKSLKKSRLDDLYINDKDFGTDLDTKNRLLDIESSSVIKKRPKKGKHSTADRVSDSAYEAVVAQSTEKDHEKKNRKKVQGEFPSQNPEDAENFQDDITDQKVLDGGILDRETKHEKIRSKFDKSSKISAKLAKKSKNVKVLDGPEGLPSEPKELTELHGLAPLPQPAEAPDAVIVSSINALPSWITSPFVIQSTETRPFKNLPLSPSTVASLSAKDYNHAFPIQSALLKMLSKGPDYHSGDICISAATGSGKTLAYVLPMIEDLRDKPVTRLRGLIVVPTRELVSQVTESLQVCSAGSGLKIGTAVGNKTLREEQELLTRKSQKYDPEGYREAQRQDLLGEFDLMNWDDDFDGKETDDCVVDFTVDYVSKVDILVCTPGRLVDHMNSTKGFTLRNVQWMVIDEADRLLDESYQQWIDIVIPALEVQPKVNMRTKMLHDSLHIRETRKVRKIILSATMTQDMSKLMVLKLKQPLLVVLDGEGQAQEVTGISGSTGAAHSARIDLPITLEEIAIPVNKIEEKPLFLLKLLETSKKVHTVEKRPLAKAESDPGLSDTSSSSESNTSSSSSESTSTSESESDSESSLADDADRGSHKFAAKPPANSTYGTLVFTNNNENALRLTRLVSLLRPSWSSQIRSLTRSTASSAGRKTLAAFRKHKLSIIVASDRASRGLDLPALAHVVNYDMPTSIISYVHRVGRTARAGKKGTATTLVAHHEARWFWNDVAKSEVIRRKAGTKIRREEWEPGSISDADRTAYELALRTLGQEARGEST